MIVVDGLTKTYGSRRVVDDLSFTVAEGRVTGFVGPNGSGKSTTMRMLVDLTRPDSGDVRYDGRPYRALTEPARTIGVALDAAAHPGRSARNHLRSLAAASAIPAHRVDEVLDEVGLTTAADQRVGGFSLGMQQRLALAGALLGKPETLMLDEPANGLDPDGIRWLRRFLRGYAERGGAVFVSSHLIAELALFADDVVVIGAGRLLAAAPIDRIEAAAERSVLVQTEQPDHLEQILAANGLAANRSGGRLQVPGAERAAVAQLALDHRIRLDELTDHQASLEDVLVDLTRHSAEFASVSAPNSAGPADGVLPDHLLPEHLLPDQARPDRPRPDHPHHDRSIR